MPKRKTIKEKKSARRLQRVLVLLCSIGIVSLIYIIFVSPLFRISNIEVKLDKINCTDENAIKEAINLNNQWIFKIDKSFEESLKRKFSCIHQISSQIVLPSSFQINASGRQPLAVIKILKPESSQSAVLAEPLIISSDSAKVIRQSFLDFSKLVSDSSFIVDSEGVVFAVGEDPSLPILFLAGGNLKLGEIVKDDLVKNAVMILSGLKVLNLNVSSSKIVGNSLVINSEPKILFALVRDIKDQLASLQLILQEAKMEDATMEFVDLRFRNPVVKYMEKKGE